MVNRFPLLFFGFFLLIGGLSAQNSDSLSREVRSWYQQATHHIEQYQFDQALIFLTRCYRQEPNKLDVLGKIA